MENTKHHRLTSFAETASEAPLQEPDRQYYFIEKAKDIFAENREQYFRDLETQALRDLQEEKETITYRRGIK